MSVELTEEALGVCAVFYFQSGLPFLSEIPCHAEL